MANRNATFAKRQRETDLKDRAKAKDERRAQKRNEVRENKGPEIAWGEAVHAVTTDENGDMPPLVTANQDAHHEVPNDETDPPPRRPGGPYAGPPPSAGPGPGRR